MIVFPMSVEESVEFNHMIAEFLKEDLANTELPAGGYDLSTYSGRFPAWPWLQHRSQCERAMIELALMAQDTGFEHRLAALHEFFLFQSIREWLEFEREAAGEEDNAQYAQERDERADRLEGFLEEAFVDLDFLNPALIAKVALESAELQQELDIDVTRYLELMPDDVRAEVEQVLAVASKTKEGSTPPAGGAKPSPS